MRSKKMKDLARKFFTMCHNYDADCTDCHYSNADDCMVQFGYDEAMNELQEEIERVKEKADIDNFEYIEGMADAWGYLMEWLERKKNERTVK